MKISVVIPCYNVESFIEECIESVLCQTYKNIEIICVDNASTDNTLDFLKQYSEKYTFISYTQEAQKGAPAARNKGLKLSKGNYIQFLDADDLLKPDKLKSQVEMIENSEIRLEVILEGYIQLDVATGNSIEKRIDNEVWIALAYSNVGITSSNLYKKTKLEEIGGWNQSNQSSQDTRLLFELLKNDAKIKSSNRLNTIRRHRMGSISKTNEKENWIRFLELRLDIINYLKKNKPQLFNEYQEELVQSLFYPIRSIYKYDPKKSVELYKKYFKGNLLKKRGSVSYTYKIIHNVFGFKIAQKIKSLT